ncbi:hypothetical protein [Rothia mucilaginosa]|uniref:hypothetical protein n=1 Tax=Rothia mucilaginosa TaxID=43675 RepID=UPI0028EA8853|nr:hypothetical protein [Rothia mucilaginosa]
MHNTDKIFTVILATVGASVAFFLGADYLAREIFGAQAVRAVITETVVLYVLVAHLVVLGVMYIIYQQDYDPGAGYQWSFDKPVDQQIPLKATCHIWTDTQGREHLDIKGTAPGIEDELAASFTRQRLLKKWKQDFGWYADLDHTLMPDKVQVKESDREHDYLRIEEWEKWHCPLRKQMVNSTKKKPHQHTDDCSLEETRNHITWYVTL